MLLVKNNGITEMTFKVGKSGNPQGRPKGAVSRRVQLANLFEPHAEKLINKTIELALSGDTVALRLCVERLVPKPKHEPLGIKFPSKYDKNSMEKLSDEILQAVCDGRVDLDEAERLKKFVAEQANIHAPLKIDAVDQVEAMRQYERIMRG